MFYKDVNVSDVKFYPIAYSAPHFSANKNAQKHKAAKSSSNQNFSLELEALSNCNRINFKGSKTSIANRLFLNLQDNNTPISILEEIKALPDSEKEEFVDIFCNETGFPDVSKFNQNLIENSKENLELSAKKANVSLLWSGYHKNCSVSKGLALPGSDLDGWSVIIDGTIDDKNNFKGKLWQNTNPVFQNIRHEFPYVFTLDELYEWTKFTDELMEQSNFSLKEEEYENNLFELDDFEKALEFNIDVRKLIDEYFKTHNLEDVMKKYPAIKDEIQSRMDNNEPKNMIPVWITSSVSTCLEPLRAGITLFDDAENLTPEQKEKLVSIKKSYLYKYGNMSMQELRPGLKPKLLARKEINEEWFNKFDTDEKLDFILKMMYLSYSDYEREKLNAQYKDKYSSMFANGADIDNKRGAAIGKACG